MPTVLIYAPRLLPPSQTFIADQAQALERWTPLLIGRESVPDGIDVDDLLVPGVPMPTTTPRVERVRRRVHALQAAASATAPDLVHAHFLTGGIDVVRTLGASSPPLVVTAHGFDATWHGRWPSTWHPARLAFGHQRRRLLRRPLHFVAVSRFIAARLVDLGAEPASVVVHHTGVDTDYFTRGLAPPGAGVLFVGRLVAKKGVDDLLRALGHLAAAGTAIPARIVGEGPELPRLRAMATRDRLPVEFLGRLSRAEVRAEMARAALFCGPSKAAADGDREGFGMVFAEAQAMGLPVVATRSGGIVDAVDDGVTGVLVPEASPAELADAIAACLRDPQRLAGMGRAAAARARRCFDLRTQTRALEAHYDEWTADR